MIDAETKEARKKRKEEGRLKKRQKIHESGGVRPRNDKIKEEKESPSKKTDNSKTEKEDGRPSPSKTEDVKHQKNRNNDAFLSGYKRTSDRPDYKNKRKGFGEMSSSHQHQQQSQHRFGRVMQNVPCRNKPRYSTLSIALPGSVLSNCQTKELRTLLVGQIARAATIYHVDEIIVFDDNLGNNDFQKRGGRGGSWGGRNSQHDRRKKHEQNDGKDKDDNNDESHTETPQKFPRSNPQEFMARVLQYCECPQYLRRQFFPMHPDLQFTGLLAPVDAPHHVRAEDHSRYREGIVLPKTTNDEKLSLVNCGIRNRPVAIDRKLTPGIRCTVEIEPSAYNQKPSSSGYIKGKVVSPSAPREKNGTYWGYQTRIANSINDVFKDCPFGGEYDLKIGTSERGDVTTEDNKGFSIPKYEHVLMVFGGVAGIEECVDADESLRLPGSQSKQLFDMW